MKNASLERKDTSLISVLQGHFKGELNLARVKLICLFITALCKIKTINYDRLASGFDTKANKSSSYRRIQRFMADFDFPMNTVSVLIFNLLPFKDDLVLVLDRTNWKFWLRITSPIYYFLQEFSEPCLQRKARPARKRSPKRRTGQKFHTNIP
jgi:hypothetical protein